MIDIIVPVYNTPRSDLERCLNSILKQTFNNYKVYKNLKQLDKFIWNMNNKKAYFEHFLIESWNKH